MPEGMYRIAIVGATSLAGKELADELHDSLLAASDFVLLDDEEETAGQLAATGDEPTFIQKIEPESFEKADFTFFTGDPEETRKHWKSARRAGASLVDMTYALEQESGILVRGPLAGLSTTKLDLNVQAVVAAHPAAVMLATLANRLAKSTSATRLITTLIEPASQHGAAAMDELHQQTVNLLSFQPLPKDQYDAQVSFNVVPALGEDAKVDMRGTEQRINKHFQVLASDGPELLLQLLQAPVFHGYTASMLAEFAEDTTPAQIEKALAGEGVDLATEDSDPPSNLAAAGQEDIMVKLRSAGPRSVWLWCAIDNLKYGALNAIACANELKQLRPRGKVQ